MKKVTEWFKTRLRRLREPKYILVNVSELMLVALAVLAYAGDGLIGWSISPKLFWTCLCVYMVYPLYKLIDHVMKTASDVKNGIWTGKKQG